MDKDEKKKFKATYEIFGIISRIFDTSGFEEKFLIVSKKSESEPLYGFLGGYEEEVDGGDRDMTLNRKFKETGFLCSIDELVYKYRTPSVISGEVKTGRWCSGEITSEDTRMQWMTLVQVERLMSKGSFPEHHKLAWRKYRTKQVEAEIALK